MKQLEIIVSKFLMIWEDPQCVIDFNIQNTQLNNMFPILV